MGDSASCWPCFCGLRKLLEAERARRTQEVQSLQQELERSKRQVAAQQIVINESNANERRLVDQQRGLLQDKQRSEVAENIARVAAADDRRQLEEARNRCRRLEQDVRDAERSRLDRCRKREESGTRHTKQVFQLKLERQRWQQAFREQYVWCQRMHEDHPKQAVVQPEPVVDHMTHVGTAEGPECTVCGCSHERDAENDRVCWCDSCYRQGCKEQMLEVERERLRKEEADRLRVELEQRRREEQENRRREEAERLEQRRREEAERQRVEEERRRQRQLLEEARRREEEEQRRRRQLHEEQERRRRAQQEKWWRCCQGSRQIVRVADSQIVPDNEKGFSCISSEVFGMSTEPWKDHFEKMICTCGAWVASSCTDTGIQCLKGGCVQCIEMWDVLRPGRWHELAPDGGPLRGHLSTDSALAQRHAVFLTKGLLSTRSRRTHKSR